MPSTLRLLPLVLALMPLTAFADESEKGWEFAAQTPVRVRVRHVKGTGVQEMWATSTLRAKPYTVQTVLADPLSFPSFMPYVKQAYFLGEEDEDGYRYLYTRLEIPGLSPRDFVSYARAEKLLAPDGTGDFITSWTARPEHIPHVKGVVRLKINQGTWHVRADANGHAIVDYRFLVDPGGFVPAFLVNMANRTVITDIYKALEKEAVRRDQVAATASAAIAAITPSPMDAGVGADGGVDDGGVSDAGTADGGWDAGASSAGDAGVSAAAVTMDAGTADAGTRPVRRKTKR